MLDFGFSEILLTSAIALVVLGPERLPKVARQVGNWMGRARAMARQLSDQLEREVNAEEFLKAQSKSQPATTQMTRIAPPVGEAPPAGEPPTMAVPLTAAHPDALAAGPPPAAATPSAAPDTQPPQSADASKPSHG